MALLEGNDRIQTRRRRRAGSPLLDWARHLRRYLKQRDVKDKAGTFTEFHDAWKASFKFHGYFIATTDNGDKVNYMYEGSTPTVTTNPMSNKWKIVGGTGKHKGIKGSGTCSGKASADGSSFDWECTGTYSIAMGKMDKTTK